jgi:hypothetical protein
MALCSRQLPVHDNSLAIPGRAMTAGEQDTLVNTENAPRSMPPDFRRRTTNRLRAINGGAHLRKQAGR